MNQQGVRTDVNFGGPPPKAGRALRLAHLLPMMAQTTWFRLIVAATFLALHLTTVLAFAQERFDAPFNRAPESPPVFTQPAIEQVTATWDRLVLSRWDSAHYISLLLRGYSQCPSQDLRDASPGFMHCN